VVNDDPALLQSLMPQGLQSAPRAGDHVSDFRVGYQLPAAYSAEIRFRRCGSSDLLAHARIAELEAKLAALKGRPAS